MNLKPEEKKKIINRFKALNDNQQRKVIESLIKSIEKCEVEVIKDLCKEKCKKIGHVYGEWSRKSYYEQLEPGSVMDIRLHRWERVCSRCGKKEFDKGVNNPSLRKKK